jgi:hypothetical protein
MPLTKDELVLFAKKWQKAPTSKRKRLRQEMEMRMVNNALTGFRLKGPELYQYFHDLFWLDRDFVSTVLNLSAGTEDLAIPPELAVRYLSSPTNTTKLLIHRGMISWHALKDKSALSSFLADLNGERLLYLRSLLGKKQMSALHIVLTELRSENIHKKLKEQLELKYFSCLPFLAEHYDYNPTS